MSNIDLKTVSFGFSDVPADEKSGLVRSVFDRVAGRYDLMNDLMSGGVHRAWKSTLIDRLNPQPGELLLDIAGGTGDIATKFLLRADKNLAKRKRPPARALVCDINHEMLSAGLNRSRRDQLLGRIHHACGDAEALPLPDKYFDAVTVSFGIRNVTHIEAALRESIRVLKIGGRFACLEFSHPVSSKLQNLYDIYSFNLIPWLGEKFANDRESYQYLVESIRRFPTQENFAKMISGSGFSRVAYENLTGGIVALHTGWRL